MSDRDQQDEQAWRRSKRELAAATACCNEARREGERAATERIAKWLREWGDRHGEAYGRIGELASFNYQCAMYAAAGGIERGEHE